MISYNNRISLRQFQILTILNVLGSGIIILPRLVTSFSMEDSWISIIIGTVFALVSVFLMSIAIKDFPNKNFVEVSYKIFSKPIGIIICLAFVIKIIMTIGTEVKTFGEITKEVMLPKTPVFIIIIIMLLISGFVASKGLEVRARVSEILILMVVLFMIVTIFLSVYSVDFSNLQPFFKSSTNNIFHGGTVTFFAFSAISYNLLVYSFVYNKKEFVKGSGIAVLIIGFIMISITIISICKFSALGVSNQLYPVLELMNSIDIPGSFLERQDALVMSFWIFVVLASINAGLFYCAIILKAILKKGQHVYYILFAMIAAFIFSFLPKESTVFSLSVNYINTSLNAFFMIGLPIAMIIIGSIRKVGVK